MQVPRPHPVTPGGGGGATTPISDASQLKRGVKKRGNYNCGRCGLPKKGHSCHLPKNMNHAATTTTTTTTITVTPTATPSTDSTFSSIANPSPVSTVRPTPPQRFSNLRRALSFDDDVDVRDSQEEGVEEEEEVVVEEEEELLEVEPDLIGSGKLPMSCLWEVLRRLPPPALLSAARVCKGWRDTTKRLWRAAEELRLRVPVKAQIGFVGSVLQKCPGLVRLSLRMERLGFKVNNSQIYEDLRRNNF